MKKWNFVILAFVVSTQFIIGQPGFSTYMGYSNLMPLKDMRQGLNSNHGFNLGFEYRFRNSPLALNTDFNFINYNRGEEPYFIRSPFINHFTRTRITSSNSINLSFLQAKLYLFGTDPETSSRNVLNPYIGGGVGIANFRSAFRVHEPQNSPNYFSEVREVLHRSNSFASKISTGFSINLSRAFGPNKDLDKKLIFLLNTEVSWVFGGRATYLDRVGEQFLKEYDHLSHSNFNYDSNNAYNGAYATLRGEFVDVLTGDNSDIIIGNVFRNKLNMFSTNVSFVMKF